MVESFFISIKFLGLGGIVAYALLWWSTFLIIDNVLFKNIEKLLNVENRVYWYDVVLLVVWLVTFLLNLILFGDFLEKEKVWL